MKLERLEIQGFKSFCDFQALTFKPGVTGIVGPNGCGKSNLSDAISWVLGTQSAQQLRGRKMDDLIFNGSRNRKPFGMAQVTIKLRAEDGEVELFNREEIEIGRRLFRTGESEYLLNGKSCRLKDIQDITMDTGLGTSVYTVIEQGKIDKILSINTQERRELMEEAAGITRFKAKRHQTDLKLQATQSNLTRLNDLMMEIDKQIKNLARQAGKARLYRRLREEMMDIQLLLYINEYFGLFKHQEEALRRISSMRDHETRSAATLGRWEANTENLRMKLMDDESAVAELKDRLFKLELDLNNLNSKVSENRHRKTELENLIIKNTDKIKELEQREGERLKALEEQEDAINVLDENLKQKERILLEASDNLSQTRSKFTEIELHWEEIGKEQLNVLSKAAETQSVLVKTQTELERERMRKERNSADLQDLLDEQQEITKTFAVEEQNLKNLDSELRDLQDQLTEKEGSSAALKDEISQKSAVLANLKEKKTRLESEIETLKKMQWAEPGRFTGGAYLLDLNLKGYDGIEGTLLDYLSVDVKYRHAVERYLEEWMRHFIVNDLQVALKLGAKLKNEKRGRAALLIKSILETRPPFPSLDKSEEKNVLATLHEIISGSGSLAHLITRMVPDAYIIPPDFDNTDIDRLRKSADLITTEGDILYKTGSFITGEESESAGWMLDLQEEIQKKTEEYNKSLSLMRELEGEEGRLVRKLDILNDEKKELEARYQETARRHSVLDEKVRRLAEERARLNTKRNLLETEREQIIKEEAALSEAVKQLENEKSNIEKEKDAITVSRETMKNRLDEIKNLVEIATRENTELQLQLNKLKSEKQQNETNLLHLRETIEDIQEQIDELNLQSREATIKIKELSEEISEFVKQITLTESELQGLREQFTEQEKEFKNRQARLYEQEQNLKTLRKQHDEEMLIINNLELELRELSVNLKNIEDNCRRELGYTITDFTELYTPEELSTNKEILEKQFIDVKGRLDKIGDVNLTAFEEYEKQKQRLEFYRTQERDLLDSISSLEKVITRLEKESRQRFMEAFEAINSYFKEIFSRLFDGGRAELWLPEGEDVLECPINISAQPPGKRLQNINLLSGGEKAMAAIALLFAIFRYKPSPFCLMDEVDATLDEVNTGRFIKMINEYSDKTQFILVTHNKRTMETADILYGVTMEEVGVSKLVSVSFIEETDSLKAAR